MTTKLTTWAGVGCLVIGPAALLAQALLTPVSVGGAADQVADAASDLSAMRRALLFDAPLLLLVAAVLFVACVAGARQSRVDAVGVALAVAGFGACALTLRRAVADAVAGRDVRTTHANAHLSGRVDEWTHLAGPSTC